MKKLIITESQYRRLFISEQRVEDLPDNDRWEYEKNDNKDYDGDGVIGQPTSTKNKQSNRESLYKNELIKLKNSVNQISCLSSKEYKTVAKIIISKKDNIKKGLGIKDDTTFYKLLRYAIAVMGRETDYGDTSSIGDMLGTVYRQNPIYGPIIDFVGEFIPKINTQSLGDGQFTKSTWDEYGLNDTIGDYNNSLGVYRQMLGSLHRLTKDYNLALERGIGTNPSVNPITKQIEDKKRKEHNKKHPNKPKSMFKIDGSGDVSLDLAILAHNMGSDKIQKYCTTSNPNYAGPCNKSTYTPKEEVGEVKVNQNDWIKSYFPNLKGGSHTAIGYVEEVVKKAKQLNCLS
jgi:hypothetical protein